MLGSTCRGLRAVCGEGEVWRLLLQRDFQGTQISASKSSDWYALLLSCFLESNTFPSRRLFLVPSLGTWHSLQQSKISIERHLMVLDAAYVESLVVYNHLKRLLSLGNTQTE